MVRARVLLLEDDPVLMGVLREVLEDESLDVTVFTSLDEIKAVIPQFPEAIVLSDFWDVHGHEALSVQPHSSRTPKAVLFHTVCGRHRWMHQPRHRLRSARSRRTWSVLSQPCAHAAAGNTVNA